MKKFIKNNLKLVLAFTLGILVSGGVVYAASTIAASTVTYDNTTSGLTATNAQAALDELDSRADTLNSNLATANSNLSTCQTNLASYIDPSYIDFTTLAANSKKTILASSAGVCIKRNGKVSCLKRNNWSVEKDHIQQIFSDVSCLVSSSSMICIASDFICGVHSNGSVDCANNSDSSECSVTSDGSVNCD